MALKLERTNHKGVTTNYHKIVNLSVHFTSENASVNAMVAHYVNKDYRDKDISTNADISVFDVEINEEQTKGNLREIVYNAMKETEEYAAAEDV